MTVNAAGGARYFLGTTDLATTVDQFAADSYVEVGEIEDLGQVGDEASVITFTSLQDGRVRKFKGPRDAGTMTIVCGDDTSDEGQAAMVAAQETKFDFNMKVILNDAITLDGTPTILYFYGKVMGDRRNIGNVSNIVKMTFNIGVNSPILVVPAT